jgi:perosamine synthetase
MSEHVESGQKRIRDSTGTESAVAAQRARTDAADATHASVGSSSAAIMEAPTWHWPPRDGEGDLLKAFLDAGHSLHVQDCSGPIKEVEELLAAKFHRKHALFCSSGTLALYSAYFALGLVPGDEVICPTITYHATGTPALHLGAHLVLADTEEDTGNISVADAARLVSPRTRVIVTNAMWGHPPDQEAVQALCKSKNIRWIEDFSHAHYSAYKGRPVGSFGDIACGSLQGMKLISGGEGGVFLTDDDELFQRAVLLGHNLKRSTALTKGTPAEPLGRSGYGLKIRGHVLAAVLIAHQIKEHADRWVEERKDSLTRLGEALGALRGIHVPVIKPYVTSMGAWYGYKPSVDTDALGITREQLVRELQAQGCEVEIPGSPALHALALLDPHRFPVNAAWTKFDNTKRSFPGCEAYSKNLLSLPTPTGPRDEHILQGLISGFRAVWKAHGW